MITFLSNASVVMQTSDGLYHDIEDGKVINTYRDSLIKDITHDNDSPSVEDNKFFLVINNHSDVNILPIDRDFVSSIKLQSAYEFRTKKQSPVYKRLYGLHKQTTLENTQLEDFAEKLSTYISENAVEFYIDQSDLHIGRVDCLKAVNYVKTVMEEAQIINAIPKDELGDARKAWAFDKKYNPAFFVALKNDGDLIKGLEKLKTLKEKINDNPELEEMIDDYVDDYFLE